MVFTREKNNTSNQNRKPASSSGAWFFAWQKRVTGDEPQGAMGRVQTAGEAPSRPLSSSRLPLRAHFHRERERERETSGYEEGIFACLGNGIPSEKARSYVFRT